MREYHVWTCCTGSILSRYATQSFTNARRNSPHAQVLDFSFTYRVQMTVIQLKWKMSNWICWITEIVFILIMLSIGSQWLSQHWHFLPHKRIIPILCITVRKTASLFNACIGSILKINKKPKPGYLYSVSADGWFGAFLREVYVWQLWGLIL